MPDRHFFENTDGLLDLETRSYSSADKRFVRIDNLSRQIGIILAHELTIRLDASGSTGRQYNKKNFILLNTIAAADRNYHANNSVIFKSNPADENFRVELLLPEKTELKELGLQKGKFSLIAGLSENLKGKKSETELKQVLQLGYISTLERAVLFPTEEELDLERRLEQVGVPVPSIKRDRELFAKQEKEATVDMENILVDLGVKKIDGDLLNELAEIKKWNSITVTDLFLHVVTEKQQKKHLFPIINLKDLVQTTDKLRADKLREDQEAQTFKIFETLGFEEGEMERRYKLYGNNEDRKLALRFLAWLSSQNFMKEFRLDVRDKLRAGDSVNNANLFDLATGYAYEHNVHIGKNKHENYDLSIDWQKEDYEAERDFSRTVMILCLKLFYNQDISGMRRIK